MIAVLALSCALSGGCGVAFGDAAKGNDFFLSLRVTGNKATGSPLTAAVSYETVYPQPVEIICELRQAKKTLSEIGRGHAPPAPNRTPKTGGIVGNFSIDFKVDAAGTYKVECYTPEDEANFIVDEINIKGP